MEKHLTTTFWLLILILIIASFLRLYNITSVPPGLYPDEAMDGTNAQEAIATGNFRVFYPENNGREGLFMNIQAIPILLFGNEPWALRIVSAFFGILTVLGLFFFTKQLFHPLLFHKNIDELSHPDFQRKRKSIFSNINPNAIALLASFFLATSFWHINFSRISFRAIMAPFFAVWAFYFLLKAFNHTDGPYSSARGGSAFGGKFYILNSLIGGLFFGLGFYSYIAFRPLPILALVIFLIYWLDHRDKAFRKKLLMASGYWLVATFIVALPLGLYFVQNPADFFGRTNEISIFNSPTPLGDLATNIVKTAGMFNVQGDQNWRHNVAGRPELFWSVGLLFLLGVILGFRKSVRRYRIKHHSRVESTFEFKDTKAIVYAFIILISWILIASLPVIISNEGLPHALRAILMLPPLMIFAALGGIMLYKFIKEWVIENSHQETDIKHKKTRVNLLLFKIATGVFLTMLVFEAYFTYFIVWGENPNVAGAFNQEHVAIARLLNTMPPYIPKYVLVKADGVLVRGIPMPTQTVMFITDTFTLEKQRKKNIHYVLPNQIDQIPEGAFAITLK